MVAYFCNHLSDNYIDLSDLYVDLSIILVDMSDHHVDLSEKKSSQLVDLYLVLQRVNASDYLLVNSISDKET